jgi:hypothetical protein
MDDPSRDAHNCAVLLNTAYDDGSSTNSGVSTYLNGAKHLGSSSHHNVVGEGWVTLAAVFASTTKGHALIKQAAITNFAGFTNHDPHAVINEHASADCGAWMDLNPSDASSQLAQ